MAEKSLGRPLRVPAIPTLSQDNLTEVVEGIVRWIQTREGRLGDGLDKAVTLRDVDLLNLATRSDIRRVAGGARALDAVPGAALGSLPPADEVPPAPTELQAGGALSSILLTWKMGEFPALDFFEIWRSPTDAIGDAVMVATTTATVAADRPPSSSVHFYWVRARSIYNRPGPYNALAGTPAALALDPAVLVAALEGQVTRSMLYADLGATVDLITDPDTVLGSVNARLKSEADARALAITGALNTAQTYTQTWAYSKTAVDTAFSLQASATSSAIATAKGEAIAAAGVYTQSYAYSKTTGEALAESVGTLSAQVANPTTGLAATRALLTTSYLTTADFNTAQAVQTGQLQTYAANAASGAVTTAQNYTQSYAYSAANGATLAGNVTQLFTKIDSPTSTNNPTYAALQAEEEARIELDGKLSGKYTIKVDLNGYVTGYGLAAEVNNGTPTSQFIVRADRFAVAAPTGPGITPAVPFAVQTVETTEGNVTLPPAVYMDAAIIRNVTALVAKFGNAWIDNAMIANLSAAKLTAGDGTIGGNLKSTIYTPGSGPSAGTGWLLTPAGNFFANNATLYGTIYAPAGAIGGIILQANNMRSSNYSAGAAGFRLSDDGSAELNNVVVRGAIGFLSNRAGSGASRTGPGYEQDTDGYRVYDDSGNIRVKLGRLS